ncbi:MAG TPA: phosphotransferase [Acidimicrobiales bacterium]
MTDATASHATAGGPASGRGAGPAPPVVDDARQLTPAWFDAVLGTAGAPTAVRAVRAEPVGTGQMATTVRAGLESVDGTARSVVVKYARGDVESTMAGMAYAKEVAFYTELGHRVAVRTPRCLYAAIADDTLRFTLVLEDLADARQGDQIAGCAVDAAEAALVNLAGLHGPTWCDRDLRARSWLGRDPSITPELMAPVLTMAADAFAERFAADLDPDEAAVLDTARELLAGWMFDEGERFAVVHGDYRLDNLLFPEGDPGGVAAVDWQTASAGPPARDLAYFLSTCLVVDDRRRHEQDLVATYHRALRAHGVGGYTLAECFDDYRAGMLHGPLIILLGRLTAGVTERGDEMFRVMWRRSAAAIHDLGTIDAVRERLGH